MTKVIEAACREDQPTEDLVGEILGRIERRRLSACDTYSLLFETKANSGWDGVRERVFQWMAGRTQALNVLYFAHEQGKCSPGVFKLNSVEEAGDKKFEARLELTWFGVAQIATGYGRTRAMAKNAAAFRLLEKLVGRLPVKSTPARQPVPTVTEATKEVAVMIDKAQGNFKGALLELCQAEGWPMAAFSYRREGPDHEVVFSAVATIALHGESYESDPGVANSKRAAEQLAAQSLLEKLGPLTNKGTRTPVQVPSVVDQNYVSMLQEFCVSHSRPIADYRFEMTGCHKPVITCTCTVQEVIRPAKAGNKKAAKQAAAKLVYEVLTK